MVRKRGQVVKRQLCGRVLEMAERCRCEGWHATSERRSRISSARNVWESDICGGRGTRVTFEIEIWGKRRRKQRRGGDEVVFVAAACMLGLSRGKNGTIAKLRCGGEGFQTGPECLLAALNCRERDRLIPEAMDRGGDARDRTRSRLDGLLQIPRGGAGRGVIVADHNDSFGTWLR